MNYDIIVIGAGSGGLNVAMFMNKAGFKVLLIDKSDKSIGGDCLNTGCVPSKALIHASRLVHEGKSSERFGLKLTGNIDLAKVMNYVKSKQNIIRKHENAAYFRSLGISVELGKAKFVNKNSVSVNNKVYSAKKIILATGSRPRKLNIPGIEKVNYHTNETIFGVKKLPKKMVIIGGGPIGIELGQAFNSLGTKVTIVDTNNKFLPKETEEISDVLLKRLKKEGMTFLFNTKPVRFLSSNNLIVETKNKKGRLEFDLILISIGRSLNIENLSIEKAGIETDETGYKLKVDNYLRTTNKNVLVCGDVAGSYQFTHAAEMHAGILLNNFFSPFKKKITYDNLSWVTYTSPEIATFDLNEKTLIERKIKYERLELKFDDDDRAIIDETTNGKLILFVAKNKILGGSMIAENAGELFQELLLAKTARVNIKNLFKKTYPYPTASRVNKKIISNHFSKKLTFFVKSLLKFLYKIF